MRRTRTNLILAAVWLLLNACDSQPSGPAAQNQGPTASFTVTPLEGEAPLTVNLDASGSTDADGQIQTYLWDLGDGATATSVTLQHTYGAGNFTIRLTVTDDSGASGSTEQAISVRSAEASGSISGAVTLGSLGTALPEAASSGTPLPGRPSSIRGWSLDESLLDFVPGEVLVKFKPSSIQPHTTMRINGVGLTLARSLPEVSVRLYRGGALGKAQTLELARALSARDDVLYAQPNYLFYPIAVPDDEFYSLQWHYPAINLPQAWDITTGAPNTVVGVVDSGILFITGDAGSSHPDFEGKVLPGYDFVSDPSSALDGDGRDDNPFDEVHDQNSFHGSHVAGTIAAASNNGVGVAGVDWQARIVPVRAIGVTSGTLIDIYEGLLWVTGFSVDGVPDNPNPATVVNMSLGGQGSCSPAVQDVLNTVLARAVVVVAAGNENQNAAEMSPASCSGVITVGATDFAGARAPYSNYGSRIDVMAPGGDVTVDLNADRRPDGVLSLGADLQQQQFNFRYLQGTSMASPHVAGVVSLMKAIKPDLTAPEAVAILRATARPLSAAQCQRASAGECGAGLIDAFAALQALDEGAVTPPPGEAVLSFEPNPLDFGAAEVELELRLANDGDANLNWQINHFESAPDNPSDLPDGAIYLPEGALGSGMLAVGQSVATSLGVDRSLVAIDGLYQLALIFEVDGAPLELTVRFSKAASETASLTGPMIVSAFIEDESGELAVSGALISDGVITDYRFEALTGNNIVAAWSDENDNTTVDEGDYFGVYPATVAVTPGNEVLGIDITVERVIDGAALGRLDSERRRLEHLLMSENNRPGGKR